MVLAVYTIALVASSVTILVMSFNWFQGYTFKEGQTRWTDPATGEDTAILDSYLNPNCRSYKIYIILTISMNIVVSVFWCRKDSSIFTSSLVNCWLTYLMWSALASSDDKFCNTLASSGSVATIQIVTQFIWTFFTLFLLADEKEEKQEIMEHMVNQGGLSINMQAR